MKFKFGDLIENGYGMDVIEFTEKMEQRISEVVQQMLKENAERTIEKVDIEAHYPSGTIFIKVHESK